MSVQFWKLFHWSPRSHCLILLERSHISLISSLAVATLHPYWVSVESIESDVSIHQHSLSQSIDEVSHSQLLTSAPNSHSRALVHFSSLPHTDDWFTVVPSTAFGLHLSDREFSPLSSVTGLGFVSMERRGPVPSVIARQILWVTIMLAAVVTTTKSFVTILFVTRFCRLPRAAASAPRRKVPSLISGSRSHLEDIFLPN